ncbi:hypothetical protein FHW12_000347 [Dokdonella fugitiva]|uniref:Uncharacterized protein n=1 Tax=Dokdonella fugitiva TaxID=328517 RepID=A0A839EUR4_9GAMM|nr:hypothetical protein [Dokdonella fugitiva]MBA8886156.1 hypothetical protein [Dokdonella fugitiva]
MAKNTKAHDDKIEDGNAQPEQAVHDDVDLVAMFKDGTTLHVHPTTVEAHERVGWKRVG